MAASKDDIRRWLERGLATKHPDRPTHVIVVCDTYDYSDYPVWVYPGQDVREMVNAKSLNMQRVMEVYNLSLPIEDQLNQTRAFNY